MSLSEVGYAGVRPPREKVSACQAAKKKTKRSGVRDTFRRDGRSYGFGRQKGTVLMKTTRPARRGRLFLVALIAGVAPLAAGAAAPADAGGLSTVCAAAGVKYPPYIDTGNLVQACSVILCHLTCNVIDPHL